MSKSNSQPRKEQIMAIAEIETIDTSGEVTSLITKQASSVHFVLQGKGGVGKSYISSLLAQYYSDKGQSCVCIDTDPINATLSGYLSFGVRRIEIMEGNDIDPRAFDSLIEEIMGTAPEDTVIIDNGASSFVPLCSYLIDHSIIHMLEEQGHEVMIHSIITGGQGLQDTMAGLDSLLNNFEGVKVTVWLNEYFGKIEKEGVSFENTDFYKQHQDKLWAIARLPEQNRATTGLDIQEMVTNRQTFREAIADPAYSYMSKHRLARVREEVFASIERIEL